MSQLRILRRMGDIGRRGQPHVLVMLLAVVVGLTLIERGQARRDDGEHEHKNSQSICEQPPKVAGKCKASYERWSFVKSSGSCEKFAWGGCGGNSNKFRAQPECERACLVPKSTTSSTPNPVDHAETDKPSACKAPKESGRCEKGRPKLRTYYDANKGECQVVESEMCAQGENAFFNELDCMQTCERTKVCKMRPFFPSLFIDDGAQCEVAIPSWSYDKSNGKCVFWTYGGCRGNANNFESLLKCEQACVRTSSSSSSSRTTSRKPRPDVKSDENKCNEPMFIGIGGCPGGGTTFWSFNKTSGECSGSVECHSYGTKNVFNNLQDCERTCKRQSSSSETTPRTKPSPDEDE